MSEFPVQVIEKITGFKFKSKELLIRAFRLPTLREEGMSDKRWRKTNVSLAFLGDSLIEFLVAEYLVNEKSIDGSPTKIRDYVVKTPTLARVFSELNIIYYLQQEDYQITLHLDGIRDQAELFEALTAVIYLDGGIEAARSWLSRVLFSRMPELISKASRDNPKGILQNYCQKKYSCNSEYRVLESPRAGRQNTYTVGVFVKGQKLAEANEISIRAAEKMAALRACQSLHLIQVNGE